MAPYEWWCPRCHVTHPPGRRVCLHCGGRVLSSRDGEATPEPRHPPLLPGAPDPGSEADAPDVPAARRVRLVTTLVWIALALAAALLRICQDVTGDR